MTELPAGWQQPDGRSCGAACVVAARVLAGQAGPPDFAAAVLATHEQITGWWPRALGTPPWAMARALRDATAAPYGVGWVRWDSLGGDLPHALYVGNRWLPRHVVLVLPGRPLRVYEPASGRVLPLLEHGQRLGGWAVRWCAVSPRR